MVQMPLDQVIHKIKERSGLSEDEINQKIDDKLTQLSGLVSRPGAAHIVANELGINLFESMTGQVQIKNILSGMKNVETVVKVQNVYEVREFNTGTRQGKVGNVFVGDETGSLRVVFWNDQADLLATMKAEDVLHIQGGYVRENQGRPEIHLNDRSKVTINPEGVSIGEVKRYTTQRKKITELGSEDKGVEILGTIVQAFEPRFFEVCPTCGKRARPHQDGFQCEEHNKVEPDYSYVMNAVIDDGSLPNGTIRGVFFRNQAERLTGKSKEEFLVFRQNPIEFENVKNDLLGKIVKLVGRVNNNTMFDRLEFVTQMVFVDPDPEEEIKRLDSENGSSATASDSSDTSAPGAAPSSVTEESASEPVSTSEPISSSEDVSTSSSDSVVSESEAIGTVSSPEVSSTNSDAPTETTVDSSDL